MQQAEGATNNVVVTPPEATTAATSAAEVPTTASSPSLSPPPSTDPTRATSPAPLEVPPSAAATSGTAKTTTTTTPATTMVGMLRGRVALVTGASRGIGRACALALAKAGADVAINYHSREVAAQETARMIREVAPESRVIVVQADVGKADAVRAMVAQVNRRLGTIGVLVNNAGIAPTTPPDEITEDDFDSVIETNLKSAFLLSQAVIPGMCSQGWGRIINITSVAAYTGGAVGPHYAASKAGMIGLTNSYSNLYVKEGITVNAVAPGLVLTETQSDGGALDKMLPLTGPGRFGFPEEVAQVVVMLAGNGYVTGQTINVDGGIYKK
ncbi:3-oxoacyl-ACP reductase FabG [Pelomyxa schiedti]|nr:3-oxoacyl-ACP reductase FabG [Pelomyxa schiedti]KAH3746224.1 3-oxoacyl-ACP reductase FabG [Pelomyxa schiedti]